MPSIGVFGPMAGVTVGILATWLGRPRSLRASLPNPLLGAILSLVGAVIGALVVALALHSSVGQVLLVLVAAVGFTILSFWVVTLVGFAFLGDRSASPPAA